VITNKKFLVLFQVIAFSLVWTVTSPASAGVPTKSKNTSQYFSGVGDSVVSVAQVSEPVLVEMTHDGVSNFAVISKTASDGYITLLANKIGSYSGTRLQELSKKKKLSMFDVSADGNWTITIKPLSSATKWTGKSISGSGDVVVKVPKNTKAGNRLGMQHFGTSNFAIISYSKKGKYLNLKANEIGDYSGKRTFGKGATYLGIESEGDWTLTRSKK
jgi:hypothetical protein